MSRRTSSTSQKKKPSPRRDLQGYGAHPPVFSWPNGARLAINFAINIEEGSEPNMLDGDEASTAALCECPSDAPAGVSDLAAENMFEYGSRVGIWRVLRAFQARGVAAYTTRHKRGRLNCSPCIWDFISKSDTRFASFVRLFWSLKPERNRHQRCFCALTPRSTHPR